MKIKAHLLSYVSASCVALAALLPALPAAAQERVLNIYNWSDYIDDSILKDFTKETGIKIVYDVYDSNEILETKLLAGGSGYDIVVPSAEFMGRQIPAGVFQKLDKDKLPNLKNMWDEISSRTTVYDPGNEYSINYMWGTTGIGFNKAKIKEALGTDEIDSWDVLFKPENSAKLKDCGIYLLDSGSEMLRPALHYLGFDTNNPTAESFAKAEGLYLSIRPNIRKFHSSEYINALANGDICMAVGYSGDIFQARDRAEEAKNGVEIGYSIPKEGALMWFDQMVIPADAKHVEEAHEFINYIMRPEVIAKASDYVFYANGNKASQEFIDKELLNDPAVYPSEEVMKQLFVPMPYPPKINQMATRTWTKIVTGH